MAKTWWEIAWGTLGEVPDENGIVTIPSRSHNTDLG
jgi:hypothetical protein